MRWGKPLRAPCCARASGRPHLTGLGGPCRTDGQQCSRLTVARMCWHPTAAQPLLRFPSPTQCATLPSLPRETCPGTDSVPHRNRRGYPAPFRPEELRQIHLESPPHIELCSRGFLPRYASVAQAARSRAQQVPPVWPSASAASPQASCFPMMVNFAASLACCAHRHGPT
jgi:hypothetical protein